MQVTLTEHNCATSHVRLPIDPAWFFSNVCLLLELYLILLSVFIGVHWGMGWFCLCFLARNHLILTVSWEDLPRSKFNPTQEGGEEKRQLLNHWTPGKSLSFWFLFCVSLVAHDAQYPFSAHLPSTYLLVCRADSIFWTIFNWVLGLLIMKFSGCFIFWIQVLYHMCFINIFPQAVACLFIFIRMSFQNQMFLISMKSNLPYFSFIAHG